MGYLFQFTSDTQTNTNTDTDTNINNNININIHINRAILGFPHIQCFVPRVQKPRGNVRLHVQWFDVHLLREYGMARMRQSFLQVSERTLHET